MLSALTALFLPFILLLGGWWLASNNEWHFWGMILMGVGFFSFIKKLMTFLLLSLHTSQQIKLLHESRTISNEYGNARLANKDDEFVQKLNQNRSGFYIGSLGDLPLFYDPYLSGNGHMISFAPSRTGKSITVVIPALLHWFGGSLLVIDIKGELAAVTARYRQRFGFKVFIFDPYEVLGTGGMKFNPLRILVEDILHNQGKELPDLARIIAYQLISERPGDMGDGVFFRNGARRLIITFLLYMPLFTPQSCNLATLRKLVWGSTGEQMEIAREMKSSNWLSGLVKDYGNSLGELLQPEYIKTFGAFRDNAMSALEIYHAHSPLGKTMEESDFSLRDILDGKTTLYLILPEDKLETHGSVLGLITTLLLETIAATSNPERVMFLLEEMGNIGKLPNLSKALSLLPGKGVRLWMILQSRRQPVEIYGQQMARLIEEQSSMVQAWSIRGELDQKAWSMRIGTKTFKTRSLSKDADNPNTPWKLSINERGGSVKAPFEIGQMDTEKQLIAIDGQMVIEADKYAYFQIQPWRTIAEKNPAHPDDYPKDKPVRHWLGNS